MADLLESQHRLVYSLLKPVARAAARFELSIGGLADLLRVAYYEVLYREYGFSNAEIASRFGQSERHMRNLSNRLKENFFAAERDVGLSREIEGYIAAHSPTRSGLLEAFPTWEGDQVMARVDSLMSDSRVVLDGEGHLKTAERYVVLSSEGFENRIDALNNFLSSITGAILQRLVFNNRRTAMVKTMTFAADENAIEAYVARLEGELRRELAALEEEASFEGKANQQFTLSLTLSPVDDPTPADKDECS